MIFDAYAYALMGCLYLDAAVAAHFKGDVRARNRDCAMGVCHILAAGLMLFRA